MSFNIMNDHLAQHRDGISDMLALKDPSLLKSQCLVDGNWIDAADGKTINVTNPAVGSAIGNVLSLSADIINEATNASNKPLLLCAPNIP